MYVRASGFVVDEMTEFAEDVSGDFDGGLMCGGELKGIQYGYGSVVLNVIVIGDDLYDSMPYPIRHIVSGEGQQLKDRINIPSIIRCEFLGEDGYLQYQLLSYIEISGGEISQQFPYDAL